MNAFYVIIVCWLARTLTILNITFLCVFLELKFHILTARANCFLHINIKFQTLSPHKKSILLTFRVQIGYAWLYTVPYHAPPPPPQLFFNNNAVDNNMNQSTRSTFVIILYYFIYSSLFFN